MKKHNALAGILTICASAEIAALLFAIFAIGFGLGYGIAVREAICVIAILSSPIAIFAGFIFAIVFLYRIVVNKTDRRPNITALALCCAQVIGAISLQLTLIMKIGSL